MTTFAHNPENAAPARQRTGWKQRLGVGAVAWVALGVVTAALDPRADGAGLIGLCGGVASWLATGAGLALAYAMGHAAYARAGRVAGGVAGGLSLAVVIAILALTNWQAVASSLMTLVGAAVLLALWLRTPSSALSTSEGNDDPVGHPYSANYSDNVDYDLAKALGWPRSVQVMTDDDE